MSKWILWGGLVLISFFLKVIPVKATVNVDVSNNGTGSNNQVIINTNTQNSNSTTDVRIESNGDVKEFHTQEDEDINYQSDDESVTVKVNNSSPSSYKTETKTELNNDVDVFVEAGGEDINEVEVATDSPEINDNVEGENKMTNEDELSLLRNILIKWEKWNQAITATIRNLFE